MKIKSGQIYKVAEEVRSESISIIELVECSLRKAKTLGSKLNYFITTGGEELLEFAEKLELEVKQGKVRSLLHGIPISLKDNIDVKPYPTSNGAPYTLKRVTSNSKIASKLINAGAVVVGKNNMHELALGITNINPHYGASLNPWDVERITGGSSGGSAGSVASRIVFASVGTDTGGSIRIPASLCGVVGLKPTYKLVSLKGVEPLAWSLDHAGPLTTCVKDAAIMLSVLTGRDYYSKVDRAPRRFRVGVLRDYVESVDDHVKRGFWKAIEKLEIVGGEYFEVETPLISKIGSARVSILLTEASLYHLENLRSHGGEMGKDVAYLLKLGLTIPATAYIEALRVRRTCRREFSRILREYDILACPTTGIQAPKIVEAETLKVRPKFLKFTEPFNLTGHPAISIPAPKTVKGLPVGVQLIAPMKGEEKLLKIARAYEVEAKTEELKPTPSY